MPAPPPRRRRGIVLALVAAIGVVAIATTAVVITRDDRRSHVRTVNSSSTTTGPRDPNVWVTAKIHLDKTRFAPGEDVTGQVVFTNKSDHVVSLADDNGCLGKWATAAGTRAARPGLVFTLECALADPLRAKEQFLDGYTVFPPGTTRRAFAALSMYTGCSNTNPPPDGEPHCIRGRPPLLPAGSAHLWILGGSRHLRLPQPAGFRILKHAPSPPFCVAGQVRLEDKTSSAFGGLSSSTFELQNRSSDTCLLARVIRNASVTAPNDSRPVRVEESDNIEGGSSWPLHLKPGQAVSFSVVFVTSTTEPPQTSIAIQFGLPNLGGPVGTVTNGPVSIEAIQVSPFVRISSVTPG